MSKEKVVTQKDNVEVTEIQVDEAMLNFCNLQAKTLINKEIESLNSIENINKNGDRRLMTLNDLRYKTFIRTLSSTYSVLECEEKLREDLIYNANESFNTKLRANKLLSEKANTKSQTRHALDINFQKWVREQVKLGLCFINPTNPKQVVYKELSKGIKGNESKEPKIAYKGLSLQCPFVEFEDQVKKMEKIIGTTSK